MIQSDLFVAGAELATQAGHQPPNSISKQQIVALEGWIDEACSETVPLRNFVLPGGTPTAAALHFSRTVCRRAERAVISLSHQQSVANNIVVYLNRLSDLLFAWARLVNHRAQVEDIPWVSPRT
jgi:cob(I)alamin adenosyltransferase